MSKILHDMPHQVEVTQNIFITLSDGIKLAARCWIPRNAADGKKPCPAILQYIPYRKRDGTRARDEPMHGFFAGHGIAALRVDMRGSGESDGLLRDEYLRQEQQDAVQVIQWISQQPWCNGAVGMMGKSWGGFNSLQVATYQPKALKAIIVLGFTDNRFTDDIHWKGGCLLNDNFWWSGLMQAFMYQPPDPAIVGQDRWCSMWLQRLQQMPLFASEWTLHQTYDAYWKHGSINEDYSAIRVPVLAVDGWADAYTNPVFRLMSHLHVPRRAIVGPWVHAYPQDGIPAPPMNFLREALQWWNCWLQTTPVPTSHKTPLLTFITSIKNIYSSPMQLFIEDGQRPSTQKPFVTGKWVALSTWPASQITSWVFRLTASHQLYRQTELHVTALCQTSDTQVLFIHTPLNHGLLSGEWMCAGVLGQTAGDQRIDNGMALTFYSQKLTNDVNLLGQPTFNVTISCNRPKGFLFAQLCDVDDDGAATRITYGLHNLVHCGPHGYEAIELVQNNNPVVVQLEFDYCGYCIPAGHRLCLSLANNYWPMVWPSPQDTTLSFHVTEAALHLPVVESVQSILVTGPDPIPEKGPDTPITKFISGKVDRSVHYDIVRDTWTCVTQAVGGVFGDGVYRFDEIDTTVEHNVRRELTLCNKDPLSASYKLTQNISLRRPCWVTQAIIDSEQTCCKQYMYLRSHMTATRDGQLVFEKNWNKRVRREAI